MITYKEIDATTVAVFLAGKRVGTIAHRFGEGWEYTPKGSKQHGEAYPSLTRCKASLSGGD